jgi:hypothetical protein
MTNFITKFLGSGLPPTAAERSAERYRQFVDQRNGVIKVYLPPKLMEEHRLAKVALSQLRADKIDAASTNREMKLKAAKAAYDFAKQSADEEHRRTVAEADAAFDAAEHELDAKAVQPLTPEQVALLSTAPGQIVRVNGGSLPAEAVTA